MRIVAAALLVSLALPTWVASAGAVVALLDEQDCLDWARTTDAIVWKQKDSELAARSLLKFDLADLGAVQSVTAATLRLFIERGQPGAALLVYHVHDASWSYRYSDSAALYNWPEADLIASVSAADTASLALDVRTQLAEDLAAGRPFSIKLRTIPDFASVRVASPLAPLWPMAPRMLVDYVPAGSTLLLPDLTLSRGDVEFNPMQPAPGISVSISARARNTGPGVSAPTTVEFWRDGPAGSVLIATAPLPALAPGGGASVVQVTWGNAPRGVHDVRVIVDPSGSVADSDEANNSAFRPFAVSDSYGRFFESFEYAGRNEYYTDFDMPPEFGLPVPKASFMERSGALSCHGNYQLEVLVDGTADDGTVWIERALPVERGSRYRVACDWREYRYGPDQAFPAVASIGVLDPEMESDFTVLGIPPDGGCRPWSYEQIVQTGPYDHIWVAMGFSIVWETNGVLGLDSVSVVLEKLPPVGAEPGPPSMNLSGPIPNPSQGETEFHVQLSGHVRLEASVYDASGRLVRRLFDGYDGPGERRFLWDARGTDGARVSSGVYFFALLADGRELGERKLVVIK